MFVELGENINILTHCVLDKIASLCLMYLLILKFHYPRYVSTIHLKVRELEKRRVKKKIYML